MKCGILMLALVLMLCGCNGENQTQETSQPDNPSETSSQTEGTATTEIHSIADIYEKTAINHIFKLNTINTDGYGVQEAYIKDGYVLLLMRDYSEQGYENEAGMQYLLNSGKVVLFPLQRPDAAVSLDVDKLANRYTLLADGAVLATNWDGSYILYNSNLEEAHNENMNCGTFLGASDQGDIWFLTEDSAFVLYRDGKQIQSVTTEGMRHGDYIGTHNGKAYFAMYNNYYGWTYATIDMQDWSYSEIRLLCNYCDVHNGLLSYNSEDKWYIADIDDPFTVTAFTKPYSGESVWDMDDRYLIGQTYYYDESTEAAHQDYRIYDLRNGGLCDKKNSSELSNYEVSMRDYGQGVILLEEHDEKLATKGLYLWDISDMTAVEPAESYKTIDYHVDQNRIDDLIQEIYDQYGVTVYYDEEHLKEYSESYDLLECSDIDLVGYTLVKLKECMAEYPDGFFEEIKGDSIRDVVFCLCGAHDRVDVNTIEDAAATVATIGDTLRMSIDVHDWQGLRRIFLHENTHMMENRLAEEMPKVSSRNYVEYWYVELNSPDCPPIQNYIWEQTDKNLKGVYDVDPDNACYIDWYSKCTINEDHARIMENGIYSGSAHYFTAPRIDTKSRFLNAMIREAFPCVKNSQEEVFWEQRTGIVDLYQEFPDFIGQR